MGSGSERCAEKWKQDYSIAGVDALALQQLYGALAWLGETLPEPEQKGANPFVTRTTKDVIEEALWARRRHLFSGLVLVFLRYDLDLLRKPGRTNHQLVRALPRSPARTGGRGWWGW
jgi:hypothetical protein